MTLRIERRTNPRDRVGVPTGTDGEVLAGLYARSADRVFQFLLARCGSRELADDLASTTFEEAARAQTSGTNDELSEGWLIVVARRRLIDHWRTVARERRRLDRLRSLVITEPADVWLDTPSVTTPVMHALASLPPSQRTAISLRYLDGLSVREVAERLDRSYRSTESLLARGRRGLAADLSAA